MSAAERLTGAILISGRGSNMAALLEAATDPAYPIRFERVVSDRTDAAGLALARGFGVETRVVERGGGREEFEARLTDAVGSVDLVCLAGFMRVLSAGFVARWSGRILNIHPSLLPAHPGLRPQAAALAAGDAQSGCTVHLVTPDVDAGPVLARARVPVLEGDDEGALAARILVEEHRLYPRAAAEHARRLAGAVAGDDLGDDDTRRSAA